VKTLFDRISEIRVLRNEPLSKYTSFHIGGNADYVIKVYSKRALKNVLRIIRKRRMKYFVIGAGTNILVHNSGFHGVVVKLVGSFKDMHKRGDYFYCGGGLLLDAFIEKAHRRGYGDTEFLAGIPGTIGGGIKGNAGAFGHSLADIIEHITIMNENGQERNLDRQKAGFHYRGSRIKNGSIIVGAQFKLVKRKKSDIRAAIERNVRRRWRRQPTGYSAGSFFKNPPGYSAGMLIKECGLKGLRIGDAEVSRKHGNFIVNRGHATASDVLRLARKIKKIVREKTGIRLKEEVKILK
jgi:UDP-N-acetylmuramate dehydrogenase